MSENRNEPDAFAETQRIPAIPPPPPKRVAAAAPRHRARGPEQNDVFDPLAKRPLNDVFTEWLDKPQSRASGGRRGRAEPGTGAGTGAPIEVKAESLAAAPPITPAAEPIVPQPPSDPVFEPVPESTLARTTELEPKAPDAARPASPVAESVPAAERPAPVPERAVRALAEPPAPDDAWPSDVVEVTAWPPDTETPAVPPIPAVPVLPGSVAAPVLPASAPPVVPAMAPAPVSPAAPPPVVPAAAPMPVSPAAPSPAPVTPAAPPPVLPAMAPVPTSVPAAPVTPKPAVQPPVEPPAAPPAKPDGGGFAGPPRWQEHVPFDETGVLLRPESLRAKAMLDETELISAVKAGADGHSEAAKSQRPGFWTGARPRRALLAVIMFVQALLSLRNNNSPFVDESLYLYSGHEELGHMLHGTATSIDFWTYFSGAPVLYPPLGALADQLGGIFGARLLSLLFMLGTTGLLYLVTRRLFGTRAGLCAAGLFSCTEATVFLGGLATYDAPALFLLALATWLVVRFAAARFPWYLLAVGPAALAVGTKYVSLLFVPTVFALALLAAAPAARRWALIRPVLLSLGTAALLYGGYRLAGTSGAEGISATTTSRAHGTDTTTLVMQQAAQYGGVVFAIALFGAVFVLLLPRQHAHPAIAASRWQRALLVALLAGTALLAPLYQAHLHTAVSLQKHVGFGLFFAAPLAGYGLVRIVGPHFHRLQLGIGVLVLTFAFGMEQSLTMFHSWPNSYASVAELVKYQKPGAHYLFADGPNGIYQLRGDRFAEPTQINDAFSFGWWDEKGRFVTGETAYADAIQAGYFQVVVYDFTANPGVEQSIAQDLYDSPIYRLAAKIPSPTSGGPAWSYVWVLK